MSRPVNIHVVLEWASQGTAGPTANLEGAPAQRHVEHAGAGQKHS